MWFCLACQTRDVEACADHAAMSSGNMLCVELGKRIRSLRRRKGWTQVELAVHLGINRGHLSDLELGKREIGLLMLQTVAKGLDTTMEKLLRGL